MNIPQRQPAEGTREGFTWPVRVYWEDTDAGGIVFYANYLKYFERGRTEWLRALGIAQQALRETTGGMFIVSDTQVRYLRPARLDDELHILTRVVEAGRASLVLAQQAWRRDTLLCEGDIRIGWVDAATLRPARIPPVILTALTGASAAATPEPGHRYAGPTRA